MDKNTAYLKPNDLREVYYYTELYKSGMQLIVDVSGLNAQEASITYAYLEGHAKVTDGRLELVKKGIIVLAPPNFDFVNYDSDDRRSYSGR